MELELVVLDVAKMLENNVVYVWRWNFDKIKFDLPTSCSNNN
jgi:hypothetical protein